MRGMKQLFLIVFVVSIFAGSAQSSIVYNNGTPDQQNGNETTQWVQSEDFVLNAATTLTDAHFWTIESGTWDNTLQWFVFADNGGQPAAAPLASGNGTSVSKVATGNTVLGFYTEYAYNFNLDTPVALAAATTYWFGLHLSTNFNRDEIYWETTNVGQGALGSTGEESDQGTFNNWSNNGQHHAFYLTDDNNGAVPELSSLITWAAILSGAGPVFAFRRQRGLVAG